MTRRIFFILAILVCGLAQAAGQGRLCPVELLDRAGTGGKPSYWASWIPESTHGMLARNFSKWKPGRTARLLAEVQELIPSDARDFMAAISQSSQSYLVLQLPNLPDFSSRTSKETEWYRRIGLAHSKLKEALELEKASGDKDLLAALYLDLAILEGFSYGFADSNQREDAAQHFQSALALVIEKHGEESSQAMGLRFLLGKHVANSFPHMPQYVAVAGEQLHKVLGASQSFYPEPTLTPVKLRFLETVSHLAVLERWPAVPPSSGPTVESIYLDLLRCASPEWVEAQVGNQHSLLWRLNNRVRWGYQKIDSPKRDPLFKLEQYAHLKTASYGEIAKYWRELGYPTR